jgi:hypothetical protein
LGVAKRKRRGVRGRVLCPQRPVLEKHELAHAVAQESATVGCREEELQAHRALLAVMAVAVEAQVPVRP